MSTPDPAFAMESSEDQRGIAEHLARQVDCPPGFVRLDNGMLRPIGGAADNADPDLIVPARAPAPSEATVDSFRRAVGLIRSVGFTVFETAGCYGRSNGLGSYYGGAPVGRLEHHYVCSLNPSDAYINGLISMLVNGSVITWFADVKGRAWLICTGPANHAGRGDSSTLAALRAKRPVTGPTGANDITGNWYIAGTEAQHPGDSTPWPTPLLNVQSAIAAADAVVFGFGPEQSIEHKQWTNRKIDRSTSSGGIGAHRARMTEYMRRMTGQPTVTPPKPPIVVETPMPVDLVRSDDDHPWYAVTGGYWRHVNITEVGLLESFKMADRKKLITKPRAQVQALARLLMGSDKDAKGNPYVKPDSTPPAPVLRKHKVEQGETLSSIARKYPPITWEEIAAANKIAAPYNINIGQVLTIPNPKASTPEEPTRDQ